MLGYFLLFSGGVWITYGLTLILLGFFAMLWVLIDWCGGVHMGLDPVMDGPTQEIPAQSEPTEVADGVYQWPVTPMPNYVPYVAEFVEDVYEAETVVFEITEDMVVDPLAATIEIQRIEDTPLFFTIKHPKPLELESFTTSWTRERIERIREMKP